MSPTMPALHRYTGVLYDNLDVTSLRGASAARRAGLHVERDGNTLTIVVSP
ncbi:Uncharacterised protein [Mycobacteroides abscessus subsp. abscessus]|nr:Uncharacterised protein [Mycobacteroides abscessus subsp. abscessus]